MPPSDTQKIFGVNAGTVDAMLAQYDADVMIRPIGAGRSLMAALKAEPDMPPHIRRMLVMLDALPDVLATLEKDMRRDGRVIYHLRRTYTLDPTVAWDGREFVFTTGSAIEEWLRGDCVILDTR